MTTKATATVGIACPLLNKCMSIHEDIVYKATIDQHKNILNGWKHQIGDLIKIKLLIISVCMCVCIILNALDICLPKRYKLIKLQCFKESGLLVA